MKKFIAAALVASTAFAFTGCATAKKKFVRKQKEQIIRPVVYTEETTVREYTNKYYYQQHFTYWKTWHEELLNYLGRNSKRESRSISEMLSNLVDMRDLLNDPERSALDVHIQEIEKISQSLEDGVRGVTLRSRIEKLKSMIASDFYYEKVKNSVIPDDILPPPAPDAPPAASPSTTSQ